MITIKNIPDKIYLQLGLDNEADGEQDFNDLFKSGGVTWCNERIYNSDIEFNLHLTDKIVRLYKS